MVPSNCTCRKILEENYIPHLLIELGKHKTNISSLHWTLTISFDPIKKKTISFENQVVSSEGGQAFNDIRLHTQPEPIFRAIMAPIQKLGWSNIFAPEQSLLDHDVP